MFAGPIEAAATAAFERLKPAGPEKATAAVEAALAPLVAQAEAALAKLDLRPAEIVGVGAPTPEAPPKPRAPRAPKEEVETLDAQVLSLWASDRLDRSSATVYAACPAHEQKAVYGALRRLVGAGKLKIIGKGKGAVYCVPPKEGGAA